MRVAMYKVVLHYSDGTIEEEEEIFESEAVAKEHGSYMCACVDEGAEILNMSNPGDYPLEDACTAEYEVIEIDD